MDAYEEILAALDELMRGGGTYDQRKADYLAVRAVINAYFDHTKELPFKNIDDIL